jgi:GT2 family glycosyltransferase
MKPVVIVPVFNAFEHLSTCLKSVEECSPDLSVLVNDDASTDLRIREFLEAWQGSGTGRTLLSNKRNRGFVHSVNRGMADQPGDVILLNSDTVVTPGWEEALSRCLNSNSNIATATPWSNNGEIVSIPSLCVAAPVPDEPAQLARAISNSGPPEYPQLPTAVGFCMAISRAAIEIIGMFDEATFGLGYGEENDFSMRARAAGMTNVLCDDAYVAHHGGGSFSPLGLKPDSASMQRLLQKHPAYAELVTEFIRNDPLSKRRQAVNEAISRSKDTMR